MKLNALLVSICLITIAAIPSFAMMSLGDVSPAKAKELGMEIRDEAHGTNQVWVQLTFPTDGIFKEYHRTELWMTDGDKYLLVSTIKEDQYDPKPNRVHVSLTVDRDLLKKTSLVVIAGPLMDYFGERIHLKDFVPAELLKPGSAERHTTASPPATDAVPLTPNINLAPPASERHHPQPPPTVSKVSPDTTAQGSGHINGPWEYKQLSGIQSDETLNKMSGEGWSIVNVTGADLKRLYLFKRAKP